MMCPDAVATADLFRHFLWSGAAPMLITISVMFAVPRIISGFLL